MGLLDFANTDDGMQGLGLLAAAAPSMAPMNIAGRIAQAAQGYQGMKTDRLKQQGLAQELQMKNMALQQQQQEWALQLPLLKAMSDRMSGVAPSPMGQGQQPQSIPGMPSAEGSPPAASSLGGSLVPIQRQPTQQGTQGSPQGGSMFPSIPDNVALPTAAFGGMKALIPLMTKYNEPTELIKQMNAAGIDPASPLGKQILQQAIAKANYQAPTRLGEGAYADPVLGVVGLPAAAQPGFINVRNPDGSWSTQRVGGGVAAVTESTSAKAAGNAAYQLEKVWDPSANGGKGGMVNQTVANVANAAGGQSGFPTISPSVQAGRDTEALSYAKQDIDSAPTPQAKAQAQQVYDTMVARRNAGQSVITGSAKAPMAAAPPLGETSNANAAQQASADTMKASYAKLQSSNSTSQAALDAIAELQKIGARKNSVLQSGVLGTMTTAISPDAAKYEKLRANLITQLAAQNGTNGSDAGRELTGEMVPDFGKPKGAIAAGMSTLENQVRAQQLKNQVLTPIFQSGDSKKYTDMESKFDQNIAPSLIPKLLPILSMPASPSRGMLLKNLQNDPAMKKALTFAAENGLLK